MLSHPLCSTPQTKLHLPRFLVAYSFHPTTHDLPRFHLHHSVVYSSHTAAYDKPMIHCRIQLSHQSLRPSKTSLAFTLSLAATYTIAYDLTKYSSSFPSKSKQPNAQSSKESPLTEDSQAPLPLTVPLLRLVRGCWVHPPTPPLRQKLPGHLPPMVPRQAFSAAISRRPLVVTLA